MMNLDFKKSHSGVALPTSQPSITNAFNLSFFDYKNMHQNTTMGV